MKKTLIFFACLCFATLTLADEVAADVEQGANSYDRGMCVSKYTDDCINMECVEGDSANDCTQQCQRKAQDKCKAQSE